MTADEETIIHRHEFIITQDNITCNKCGKVVPIVESLQPEAPPTILWGYLIKLGGLGGKALYFKRTVEAYTGYCVFLASTHHSTDVDFVKDAASFRRTQERSKRGPRQISAAYEGIRFIFAENPVMLHFANDALLDLYFIVDSEQRQYLQSNDVHTYFDGKKNYLDISNIGCKSLRLEVKLGKIIHMSFTEYDGSRKPTTDDLRVMVEGLELPE